MLLSNTVFMQRVDGSFRSVESGEGFMALSVLCDNRGMALSAKITRGVTGTKSRKMFYSIFWGDICVGGAKK